MSDIRTQLIRNFPLNLYLLCKRKIKSQYLNKAEIERVIEMAWEDRTPFEAINFQFNLKESDVIQLIRLNLKTSSFKLWRKRFSGRKSKHSFANEKKPQKI